MDDMNRNIDNYGMICMSCLNDDEYWMTCLNNSNDAGIDYYCIGQYVFENGIWNGKGIKCPELGFRSTRQTEQATQSTQALGNQEGILDFIS